MPLLIDGNNLLHRLPSGARSRGAVRRDVLDACRGERMRVTVVFDGPPPAGAPRRELLGAVTILYAGPATADDAIIGELEAGGRARDWVVVSDDAELRRRARARGAGVRSLADWSGRRRPPPRPALERGLSAGEVADWEEYFAGRRRDGGDR